MASPIAHIVFGKVLLERIPDNRLSWPEFIVGTSFPDIRYPAGIKRELTHFLQPSQSDIPLNNSFRAGMYVLSLIDHNFSRALKTLGLYYRGAEDPIYLASLKFAEDRIVYAGFKDKIEVSSCFESFYPDEYEFVPDGKMVKTWHQWMQEYIINGPTDEIAQKMVKQNGFSKEMVDKAYRYLLVIENNNEIMDKLAHVKDII